MLDSGPLLHIFKVRWQRGQRPSRPNRLCGAFRKAEEKWLELANTMRIAVKCCGVREGD